MATAADIGANFSDYVGNAGAAGGNFGPIVADTRPLEQLAAYTMLANQVKWKQQQAQTDATVAQLADLSNISLNDLRAKDKVQATQEFSTLLKKAAEYARKIPKTPQERIQNELDWQTEYGKFKNNYNSGKQRAISYTAHYNTIKQNVPNAATQNEAIRQLDRQFDSTDIGTPISALPNFKLERFDIPNPVPQKFATITVGANDNIDMEGTIYNPKVNAGVADANILAINKTAIKQGTPEYDALSQNEKDQADIQATVDSEGKGWIAAVEPLNDVLKKYVDPTTGEFQAKKFEDENASNLTLMNAYNAAKNLRDYSIAKKKDAEAGVFNDKGLQFALPQNVRPEDFNAGIVDFASGVTPNQLVQAGMFAKWKGDEYKKDVKYTGAQDKKKDLSLEWYKAKTGRISATKPTGGGGSGSQANLLTQPALIFGEHINRLKSYFNKQGSGDSFKINYEGTDEITRKALGLDKGKYVVYQKDGTALVNADKNGKGGIPLTIEQQKNNFIVAVKGGSKDEAIIDAKFLGDAEEGINTIFGTTSGTQIWNNWGQTPTAKAATSTTTEAKPDKSGKVMSDAEYDEFLKKNGLK